MRISFRRLRLIGNFIWMSRIEVVKLIDLVKVIDKVTLLFMEDIQVTHFLDISEKKTLLLNDPN